MTSDSLSWNFRNAWRASVLERKTSEFFEFTPFHRFPFVRRGDVLECWHPMVFYRGMETMVHSVLSEAGAAYIEPFSKLFETHIRSELRSTECAVLDENELRGMLGQHMQVPDALLSFPEANVFVEAKAGLFDESVMVREMRKFSVTRRERYRRPLDRDGLHPGV
jgi:hypothetical protein